MKKFLALYMAPLASFEKVLSRPKEDMNEDMKVWEQWMKQHQSALTDSGAPLGKTKRIDSDGTSDMRNTIGGYSILQAASLADAAKILSDNPHLKMLDDAWIEVIECLDM